MWINDVDSRDYGIRVLSCPPVAAAQKNIKTIAIPGRSDLLTKWHGDYLAYEKTARLFYAGANKTEAGNFLASAKTVRWSNDENYLHDVVSVDFIKFDRWIREKSEFYFNVLVQPLKRLATEEPLIGATVVLENAGNVPCKPRIEITATGTVTVNDITVTGVTGTLVIDNHLGLVYDGAGNAFNRMSGNLFEVSDSLTILANGVMTVYPQQRWI